MAGVVAEKELKSDERLEEMQPLKLPEEIANACAPLFEALPLESAMAELLGSRPKQTALVEETLKHPALANRPELATGLWLYVDDLERSHAISQGIESATGSYWHAIMHLFCGSCGRPLYGNHNTSKPDTAKRKSGKTIYVCKTAINYGKSCDCGQWSVGEQEMLEFLSVYGTQLIEPAQVERAKNATPTVPPSKDIPRLQRALSEINKKIDGTS